MIAYLNGQVLKKLEKDLIVENSGIGYVVHVPSSILVEVEENSTISLFIHHHVREDANELFGLKSFEDLSFFKQLIQISGIGPKMALEIINSDINKIKNAIINEDSATICKIPGVGQKTAKRIILELKNKVEIDSLSDLSKSKTSTEENIHTDAIDALTRLGYQRHQITKALKNMPEEIIIAEEVVTYFLRNA